MFGGVFFTLNWFNSFTDVPHLTTPLIFLSSEISRGVLLQSQEHKPSPESRGSVEGPACSTVKQAFNKRVLSKQMPSSKCEFSLNTENPGLVICMLDMPNANVWEMKSSQLRPEEGGMEEMSLA